jgi:KDO2-lipid IV(A) lauroyltransferase
VSALLFQIGSLASRSVPGRVRYGAARAAGAVGFATKAGLRRQAIQNYAGVLGLPPGDPRVRRVAREAVVGYTKLLADFLLLSSLTPERLRETVEVTGLEHVREGLDRGRGVIVVTAHFGNWDIAAAAAVAHGIPVTAVTDAYGDSGLNGAVVAAREKIGMKVLPLDVRAGRGVLGALRRNEVVALVCDLPKEGRNVEVVLCGQKVMVPAGPALLSLRSGAPIIPISCHRRADNSYALRIQGPVDFLPTGDEDADVARLAQASIDRLDALLRAEPEQWYLFSPMWDVA